MAVPGGRPRPLELPVIVPTLCPRCRAATVAVREEGWSTPTGPRRSVWVDEPVACGRGCVLTFAQVERLLLAVYRAPVHQLPLPEAA